jgi:hypothetical protein
MRQCFLSGCVSDGGLPRSVLFVARGRPSDCLVPFRCFRPALKCCTRPVRIAASLPFELLLTLPFVLYHCPAHRPALCPAVLLVRANQGVLHARLVHSPRLPPAFAGSGCGGFAGAASPGRWSYDTSINGWGSSLVWWAGDNFGDLEILLHEIGHTYGMAHATVPGGCDLWDQCDHTCTMGATGGQNIRCLNAPHNWQVRKTETGSKAVCPICGSGVSSPLSYLFSLSPGGCSHLVAHPSIPNRPCTAS